MSPAAWPRAWTLECLGVKKYFSEHGQVAYEIERDGE